MATARRNLVDNQTPGFYHCTNRCVRRAFLCGFDKLTGRDYNHRKDWLESRMLALCELFSIDIYAYAVMDNHYHIVLYLDPLAPQHWSDERVAESWIQAYPGKMNLSQYNQQRELKKQAIINSPEKLKLYRKRLGSLSWFMGRLNEPIAKQSNQEESCSGRFWQGRYSSQALLDEGAIFSCMAYVDLNPVRAKITEKLEESDNTSIKKRLNSINSIKNVDTLDNQLDAIAGKLRERKLSISLTEYVELVEWTGRSIVHPDKASIPAHISPLLYRLNLQQNHWLKQIENYGNHYCHVVGPVEKIRAKAKQLKLRCLHGVSAASLLYKVP